MKRPEYARPEQPNRFNKKEFALDVAWAGLLGGGREFLRQRTELITWVDPNQPEWKRELQVLRSANYKTIAKEAARSAAIRAAEKGLERARNTEPATVYPGTRIYQAAAA